MCGYMIPTPVDRQIEWQTDTTETITFPHSLASGNDTYS